MVAEIGMTGGIGENGIKFVEGLEWLKAKQKSDWRDLKADGFVMVGVIGMVEMTMMFFGEVW